MGVNKILVVEDNETLLYVMKYNLALHNYDVFLAEDGEQALHVARSTTPDLIILDILLPKLDGFEVCRILRKETSVPILMLSAKTEEIDRITGLKLGANEYMTKPFSTGELLSRVQRLTSHDQADKHLNKHAVK
jgi:DNA-binding response OmpR family regulator